MKYTILGGLALLAVLTFAFGNLSRLDRPGEAIEGRRVPDYTWAEIRAIAERTDELEAEVARLQQFSVGFAEVRDEVWARKVSPWEAAGHTLELAHDLAPTYLRAARTYAPGFADREVVLLAILRHMRAEPQINACPADRNAAVYEEIVCELFASVEMSPALERAINDVAFPALVPSR